MLLINVLNGLDRGRVFHLDENRSYIVGRQRGDIPLEDRKISRKHACIEHLEGHWTVTDLQSSHGTFINKRQVREPVMLVDGEQVQLGSTLLLMNIVDKVPADAATEASGVSLDHTHRLLSELNQRLEAGGIQAQPDAATAEVLQLVLQRLDNLPDSPQAPVDTDKLVHRTEQRLRAVLEEYRQATDDESGPDNGDTNDDLNRLEAAIEALPQRLSPDQDVRSMLESLQARLDNGISEKLDMLVTGLVGETSEPTKPARGWRKKGKDPGSAGGLTRKLDQLTELIADATNGQLQQRYEVLLQAIQDRGQTDAVQNQFAALGAKIESVADRLDQGQALEQIRGAVCHEGDNPTDQAIARLRSDLEAAQSAQQEQWAAMREAIESARPDAQVPTKLDGALRLLEQAREQQAVELKQVGERLGALPDQQAIAQIRADVATQHDAMAEHLQTIRDNFAAQAARPLEQKLDDLAQAIADHRDEQAVAKLDALHQDLQAVADAQQSGPSARAIDEKLNTLVNALRRGEGTGAGSDQIAMGVLIEKLDQIAATLDAQTQQDLGAKLEQVRDHVERIPGISTQEQVYQLRKAIDDLPAALDVESVAGRILTALEKHSAQPLVEKLEILQARVAEQSDHGDRLAEDLQHVLAWVRDQQESGLDRQLGEVLAVVQEEANSQLEDKLDTLITAFADSQAAPGDNQMDRLIGHLRSVVDHLQAAAEDSDADRALLEELLSEVRQKDPATAEKLLQELRGQVDELPGTLSRGELGRRLEQVAESRAEDKIVPLLREVIELLRQQPEPVDHQKLYGELFVVLRNIEQRQERHGHQIRKLADRAGLDSD